RDIWSPYERSFYTLWNFSGTNEHHLPLQIGDTVHILQASEGKWGWALQVGEPAPQTPGESSWTFHRL
uniref:SH3 domain-containing protein n=1 Tax=Chrysemys picta bellii TaxID=8478 RepID=A0A8C3PDN0_CHRPI